MSAVTHRPRSRSQSTPKAILLSARPNIRLLRSNRLTPTPESSKFCRLSSTTWRQPPLGTIRLPLSEFRKHERCYRTRWVSTLGLLTFGGRVAAIVSGLHRSINSRNSPRGLLNLKVRPGSSTPLGYLSSLEEPRTVALSCWRSDIHLDIQSILSSRLLSTPRGILPVRYSCLRATLTGGGARIHALD